METGSDGGIMVDQELVTITQQRFIAVQNQSHVRFLQLTYETYHWKIMFMMKAGRKQLECLPEKFVSKEQADKSHQEFMVGLACGLWGIKR